MKKVVSILKMSTGKSLLDTIGAGKGTALAGTSNAGSSVLSPVSQNSQVIVVNTDAVIRKQVARVEVQHLQEVLQIQ